MTGYEEAARITLAGGIEVYRFGLFVLLGTAAAAAVAGFLCWAKRTRKGTAPMLVLLSMLLGGACSRIAFCLMDLEEVGTFFPLKYWLRLTGGGWSMMGLIAGVLLAARLTAALTRQKAGLLMDIAACALPGFMLAERLGEGGVPEFDYSRRLSTALLNNTFLTFSDYDGWYLATWKLAAIVMGILIPVLILDLARSRRDGDTCLLFLLLFGGCSVLLESLRYDHFLTVHSFVGLQHVLAAVILAAGVYTLCARTADRKARLLPGALGGAVFAAALSLLMFKVLCENQALLTASMILLALGALAALAFTVLEYSRGRGIAGFAAFCMTVSAGAAVALECALDRTVFSKPLIYLLYIAVMAVPVVQGILMRSRTKKTA